MTEHPFGWLSLLPPVVAIVLSIVTKRVVISMLAGLFAGTLILSGWNPLDATAELLSTHLLSKLIDSDTLHVFFFTILMGMMVGVINRSGGMIGMVNLVTPFANTPRRGQMTTWVLGLLIFFDDYANTLLLGKTLRPLTDKLRISREKLAYIVDSTAAPVAGLALISTWVAGEIGYVEQGINELPAELEVKPYSLFVASIPYRFYILWALLFVPIIALLGRDFGPMLKAERRSMDSDVDSNADSDWTSYNANANSADADSTTAEPASRARWYNAVIPILVTVFAVVLLLYQTGGGFDSNKSLMDAFGDANSYSSLLWGAFAGLVAAFVLIVPQRIVSIDQLTRGAGQGGLMMLPALVILWLAQTLSTMTGTGKTDDARIDQVAAMQMIGANNEEIAASLSDLSVTEMLSTLTGKDSRVYQLRLEQADKNDIRTRKQIWQELQTDSQQTAGFLAADSLRDNLINSGLDPSKVDHALRYVTWKELTVHQQIDERKADETETNERRREFPVLFPAAQFENRGTRLYTGDFLANRIGKLRESGGLFSTYFVQFLPTIIFLLASVVAFSTGTSWGTMGIVMPLAIPLAYSQLAIGADSVAPDHPIMLCCIGSVLAGAILGDHCSPISDTTVLSSQASGCDHAAHVYTQLPYALLVGSISILFGTLPIGFGFSVWLALPAGVLVMLASVFIFGTRTSVTVKNQSD